jgi:hypothetical protein
VAPKEEDAKKVFLPSAIDLFLEAMSISRKCANSRLVATRTCHGAALAHVDEGLPHRELLS